MNPYPTGEFTCASGIEERRGIRIGRGYISIIKVARRIADLAGEEGITTAHLPESIQYRFFDRKVLV